MTYRILTLAQQQAVALESYQFWLGVGLTHNEACGLIGNEEKESSFDCKAMGDNDTAYGSNQLHKQRCEVIKAGCGIDITTLPSHIEQLQGAWWELNHPERFALMTLKTATSSYQAGGLVSQFWLRPAAVKIEIGLRGALAQKWDIYFTDLFAA